MLSFTLNTLLEECNNKEARHAMHKAFSNTDEITMIDFDSFVDDMGCEPIADGVFNSRQAEKLHELECTYCAGSLAGKYMAERYVRQRNDD